MTKAPILLIHGYSASYQSFEKWGEILRAKGYDVGTIHTGNYITLTNEITIKDLAEGFNRALCILGLTEQEDFNVIVHSTGMLIVRAWLTAYATTQRRQRLKHLIGLAPASFGSPLAHKGRSWLGSIFKGNREFGPDFLEAGDLILDNLELASSFTWNLAHKDLVRRIDQDLLENIETNSLDFRRPKFKPFYGPNSDTPYVFIFCGTQPYPYERINRISGPGTDGTVRWAGCSLNTRKITIDLTQKLTGEKGVSFSDWINVGVTPFVPIEGLDHSTILREPTDKLIEMVVKALEVSDDQGLQAWNNEAKQHLQDVLNNKPKDFAEWQQFIVRAVDERNDPITDYDLQLFTKIEENGEEKEEDLKDFDVNLHIYSGDKSFRCFHVNLTELKSKNFENLYLRIIASSGSELVVYHADKTIKGIKVSRILTEENKPGMLSVELDISRHLLGKAEEHLFYPFTTTLVEIRLDREPYPTDLDKPIKLFGFIEKVKDAISGS